MLNIDLSLWCFLYYRGKKWVEAMNIFRNTYNLKCLVHEPTCFKNIDNPSCIDLILTNKSFQITSVIDTGLSDFHKLTLTTMKASFQKQEPKVLKYRNYKCFDNGSFRNDLLHELCKIGFSNISCEQFGSLFMTTYERYVRANNWVRIACEKRANKLVTTSYNFGLLEKLKWPSQVESNLPVRGFSTTK